MTIERAAVVGGGQMGAGITEVLLRAGVDVVLVEASAEAADRAGERIEKSMRKLVERGRLEESELAQAQARLTLSAELEAVADRQLVIEAATEDEATKLELFTRLGELVTDPEAILASNTSSIPIIKLGAVSGRAGQVVGVHFFNPAPVMKLVELIPSLTTSAETLSRMHGFVSETLGKQPIEATDRAGFVVNSLLVPYLLSAIRMLEAGYASAADIDQGMTLGCGHPMGPLALSDLIGLDTIRAIGVSMYEEFKEPLYAPPPLLERMVDAGMLGRKSGQGFHAY